MLPPSNRHCLEVMDRSNELQPQQESTEERRQQDINNSQLEANFYINLGNQFWQQKKLTETVEAYRQAIELETKSPQVYYRMAEALKQLGNVEEAAFYYRMAVSVQNNSRSTTEEPLKITDMAGEIESKPVEATAESTYPPQEQTTQIYLEQANSYIEEQQWDSAIFACQEAIKISPKLAEAYKIWGNALQKQGKISDAMGYYAQALTLQPNSPEIYANLGSIYAQKKKWQEALEYYQRAVALKPDFAGVYRNLAKVWTQLGNSEKASEANNKAIELEPSKATPQELAEIGERLVARQRPEDALNYYRQALQRQPNSLELYRSLAGVLEQLQRWQDAAACYRKIAELERLQVSQSALLPQGATIPPSTSETNTDNTNNNGSNTNIDRQEKNEPPISPEGDSAEVYVRAGNALVQQQQWQQAISVYNQALKLDPNRPDIYRQTAKIIAKLGQKDAAADYWYRALGLEGKQASPTEYLQLGHLWCELTQIDRAVDCYRRALQLQPTLTEAYHHFGKILAEAGNLTELVELYKLAITYNPENSEHYYHLAEVCRYQGDWQVVTACYQKALTITSDNWEIHHNLGDSFLKQEKYAEAITAYRSAIELNPNSFWSCHNLGYALLNQQNLSEALTILQRAIALKQDFFWTYYNLGNVYIQSRQWDKAAAAFARVLQLQPDFSPAQQKLQYVERHKTNADLDLAFQLYLEAIKRNPNDIESYQKALEIQSDRPHLHLELARILQQNGRIDEAIVSFQNALDLDPQNIDIYQSLGELLCQQGDGERASRLYQQGLSQFSDCPGAIAKLNSFLARLSA
jgi:O-antigen biosynthesis protein